MPDAHAAEARKLDRLVFGDGVGGSRSAGSYDPLAPGAVWYAENNAMRRGQNGDKNDEGVSGEIR